MRIDLGMDLCIALEYVFFIHYADTLFYRKKNNIFCYSVIAINYFFHFLICILNNVLLNSIVFLLVNMLCFLLCYHINVKNAVLQSIILLILSIASELIIAFIPHIDIQSNRLTTITPVQSLILTLSSKSLYLIELLIVSRIFLRENKKYGIPSLALIFIPAITVTILILIFKTNIASNLLSGSCFLLILINCIMLYINNTMTLKDLELAELKSEHTKHSINLEEYALLKERNELARIFRHNFKAHINALPSLIRTDPEKALEYIQDIYNEATASEILDYTDNTMLNIILTQKSTECSEKGISFNIEQIARKMSFIASTDTVALFSNLISNAMESCEKSEKKEIFLNITTTNKHYMLISIENSSDKEPLIIDGRLRTHKANRDLHGIGMNSIRRIINNYDGILKWNYNPDNKEFCTNILLKNNISDTTEDI